MNRLHAWKWCQLQIALKNENCFTGQSKASGTFKCFCLAEEEVYFIFGFNPYIQHLFIYGVKDITQMQILHKEAII